MAESLLSRETLTFLPPYEAPVGELEQQIADLIAEHFKLDRLGRDDDFFDLGGDSLAAVALAEAFEQRFGKPFQSGLLIEHSTASALARYIGGGSHASPAPCPDCLTAFQTGGQRQPLFQVHGALGITFVDKQFLGLLGPDQPVYFFRLPGLDASSAPFVRVEELAAHYIAAMRAVQPEGPYAIGANCACCLIGLEMAFQLERAGAQVSTLLLVDPGDAPSGHGVTARVRDVVRGWKRAIKHALRVGQPDHGDDQMLPDAEWNRRVDDFAKSYRNAQKKARAILDEARQDDSGSLPGVALAEEAAMAKALTLLRDALVKYRPHVETPYAGRVDMIVCDGRLDHVAGWRRVLANAVVHRVPGSHADIFNKHLDVTVGAMRDALNPGRA